MGEEWGTEPNNQLDEQGPLLLAGRGIEVSKVVNGIQTDEGGAPYNTTSTINVVDSMDGRGAAPTPLLTRELSLTPGRRLRQPLIGELFASPTFMMWYYVIHNI